MKRSTHLSMLRITISRVIRWTAIDAVLGGTGGALFGGAFGGLGLLIQNEPSSPAGIAAYFAVCGAVAGALVGTLGAILEGGRVLEGAPASSNLPQPATSIPVSVEIGAMNDHARDQRISTTARSNRKRLETIASHNPSWN